MKKFKYIIYLKDHQGNNRVVLGKNDSIMQVNHYYPFGALFGESKDGGLQKYKYNGKELERMYELDLYDYGARMMDPILGRFTTPDPLCEKYYSVSPYAYCNNNPIKYIDSNGEKITIWYHNEMGKQKSFIFNGKNGFSAPNNRFVSSIINAYNYNIKNGGGQNLEKMAISGNLNIGIVETDKDNRFQGGFIRFNPSAGLQLDDGNILSPATGLEHEAAHAVNNETGKQDNTFDSQYGTKEERSVIKGAECTTAKANGELPKNHKGRSSHAEGTWIVTKSVISNQELDKQRSVDLRKRIENFNNSWTSE